VEVLVVVSLSWTTPRAEVDADATLMTPEVTLMFVPT
jgi:hypothetical protein